MKSKAAIFTGKDQPLVIDEIEVADPREGEVGPFRGFASIGRGIELPSEQGHAKPQESPRSAT